MAGSVHQRLAVVFHPRWCSADDHFIMQQKAGGVHFSRIAQGIIRDTRAVEQRWHRLRKVPNIERLLEDYGLSRDPYPEVS
jgi:hypothetical protein